jgi:hypothetical protein
MKCVSVIKRLLFGQVLNVYRNLTVGENSPEKVGEEKNPQKRYNC